MAGWKIPNFKKKYIFRPEFTIAMVTFLLEYSMTAQCMVSLRYILAILYGKCRANIPYIDPIGIIVSYRYPGHWVPHLPQRLKWVWWYFTCQFQKANMSSWWFPPIWKLSVKLDHVPLKAPPRCWKWTNPSKLALFWKIWKGRQVDSGQIRIFHQPTFPWNKKNIPCYSLPFGVSGRVRVAIISPDPLILDFKAFNLSISYAILIRFYGKTSKLIDQLFLTFSRQWLDLLVGFVQKWFVSSRSDCLSSERLRIRASIFRWKRTAVGFREAKKLLETNREFYTCQGSFRPPEGRNEHLPTIPCSGANSLLVFLGP